jgi:hypothetical protein
LTQCPLKAIVLKRLRLESFSTKAESSVQYSAACSAEPPTGASQPTSEAQMKSPIAVLGFVLAAIAMPPTVLAAPIPEYRALYRAVDESDTASAEVSLSYDSVTAVYTLTFERVDATAREFLRSLRFDVVDARVRPLTYRQQNGRCMSCTLTAEFDWNERRVDYYAGGGRRRGSLAERNGTPNIVFRDVAMLVAMLPGRRELAGFYHVLAAETPSTAELVTAIGPVHAEERALRWTTDAAVWLAPQLEHLPVRMRAFGTALQIAELHGIELRPIVVPSSVEAAVRPIPEYRAVYRVDYKKTVGAGRLETALRRDPVTDRYELVVTAVELKEPESQIVMKVPFHLVGERVQPLALNIEYADRRPLTGGVEFDWESDAFIRRINGKEDRFPLIALSQRYQHWLRTGLFEPLAELLALLPGSREIVGFDALSSEALGAAELALPMGLLAVERVVMRAWSKDANWEIWRSPELADLPVRLVGAMTPSGRKVTVMELTELYGLERAPAPP